MNRAPGTTALRVGLLPLVMLLASCGGPDLPAEYLKLEIVPGEAAKAGVTAGQGFDLTVRRTWSKDLVPVESEEDLLPPLQLRLEETDRRENDTHVEETRRYLAYAFTPGDVTVRAPSFAARPVLGGAELVVRGADLELVVRGDVDPEAPGAAELPGGPLEPRRFFRKVLIAVVILTVVGLVRRRRRGRPDAAAPPEPAPTPPPLEEVTLRELGRLRAQSPSGRKETQAFYREVTELLRGYLGRRFSIHTRERTTEQLTALAELAAHRARLSELFARCDLVKFARHEPSGLEREQMLDSAESLVAETSAA